MAAQDTSALLIGSYKFEERPIRDGDDKKVDKKGGIRRGVIKAGKPVQESQWAIGDLNYMNRFLEGKQIDVFSKLNYFEQNPDGTYREGRKDILEELGRFFQQDQKTHFVLYFTGHGAQDGSWCFPVSTRKDITRSRSSTSRSEENGEPFRDPAPITPSNGGSNAATEVLAEVYDDARGKDNAQQSKTLGEGASNVAQLPQRDAATNAGISAAGSFGGSLTSLLSKYDNVDSRPDATSRCNDFITYEDVIKVWDENKRGRARYLMIILDCCHSGKWVNYVNGEEMKGRDDKGDVPNNGPDATSQPCREKRHDVCIQAACQPAEESTVANDQQSSLFTRAFVEAQERSLFEKMVLAFVDHAPILNVVSMTCSPILHPFTPISSDYAPFGGIAFFDTFDDMHLKT